MTTSGHNASPPADLGQEPLEALTQERKNRLSALSGVKGDNWMEGREESVLCVKQPRGDREDFEATCFFLAVCCCLSGCCCWMV